MAGMKTCTRWLSLLGSAVIIAASSVVAQTYGSSSGCNVEYEADGYCDQQNNNAECGYDGGDCCSCTCEAESSYLGFECGIAGYACVDPEAVCVDDDDVTIDILENCGYALAIGNGYCDQDNNKEECGYDGGDCCECTCGAPAGDDDYDYYCHDFACIDPAAPCVDDDDVTAEMVESCGYILGIGNGYCDQENNNEGCGFDGGDCCECTCEIPGDDGYGYYCNSFACVDPSAPCVDDDDMTIDMVETCGYIGSIGNGYCDSENNNAICGYDGGDCCECTCEPYQYAYSSFFSTYYSSYNSCGNNFACIDPEAPCVDDDDITIDTPASCDSISMNNAYCDERNNNAECAYDGGDCCECTCEDRYPYQVCGQYGFACIDPDAICVNDDDITVDMVDICNTVNIGDGWCDTQNNNPECNYDGGDCCKCTCLGGAESGGDDWRCGEYNEFACIDPEAPCADDDSVTVDMIDNCYAGGIGNGWCDLQNNNAECAYDGGDCCECTCSPTEYGYGCQSQFACIDPDAPCVDDDLITVDMFENCGYVLGIGNSYCDDDNNNADCAYDGGDCCECTCVPETYSSGRYGYSGSYSFSSPYSSSDTYWQGCREFACIDPEASCVNDDDITVDMFGDCGSVGGIGNGYCDPANNKEECNYDGGDCCSCTCETSGAWDDDYSCSAYAGFDCQDPAAPCFGEPPMHESYYSDDDEPLSFGFVSWEQDDGDDALPYMYMHTSWEEDEHLPTVDGAVEVGEVTAVSATATAHDERPGATSGDSGCGEAGGGGCAAANSRDGIISDVESRWSCATKLVPDEGPCQIEYTFAAPQDIVDIQVAFWKGNERIRTLEVHFDGMLHHTHESYLGSTFNTLGVEGTGVSTVMLQSIDLLSDEWISLIEVLIFVTP